MNEFDSPNYTEYTYTKKSEGNLKILKYLFIVMYMAFVGAFFLVCYVSRVIPMFAVCPIFTWILIFFTWRLVSFDCYYEFKEGILEVGKVKVRKSGRIKSLKLRVHVKEALYAAPYEMAGAQLAGVKKVYDYSESIFSEHRIVIIFSEGGERAALIIEGTAKIAKLISSLCEGAEGLKGRAFHG